MPVHIQKYDNNNKAIIGTEHHLVPRVYFNRICLKQGESYRLRLKNYEAIWTMVRGTCSFSVDDLAFPHVGGREDIWQGRADSVYVPQASEVQVQCTSVDAEIYIGGGLCTESDKRGEAAHIKPEDVQVITYGSDETKTHRCIQHILGQNSPQRMGRLLVSELFTVGQGGWSGFPPHKHDEDRMPMESAYEEVYHFRFTPPQGFAAQFAYNNDQDTGPVFHVKDGSTVALDRGYHPVVVAPGYQMYYFTIIVGKTQKSLVQHFQEEHKNQLETIPGIKDMIAAFK